MDTTPFDEAQVRTLLAEHVSQREIARRLGIPEATLRRHIKDLGLRGNTPPPLSTQGIPNIHTNIPEGIMVDLQDLVDWWRHRKAALLKAGDADRETERTTYHVEKRWVEAIRRQADLEGSTYTQIVNEAFRQYFEGKQP